MRFVCPGFCLGEWLGAKLGTGSFAIGCCTKVRAHLPDYVLMENVVGVQKIMDVIQQLLRRIGYDVFCTDVLNPKMLGLPHNRPRVYFGGRLRSGLKKHSTSYGSSAFGVIDRAREGFADQLPMPLEAFLLDTINPYYSTILADAVPERSTPASKQAWLQKHAKAFANIGTSRPSTQLLKEFAGGMPSTVMAELFLRLPLRSQEIAYFAAVVATHSGPEVTVDLSQSIERAHINTNDSSTCAGIHCFTARSLTWLVRSRRLLSGRERLAMHGISSASASAGVADTFLGDLAGNSFSATSFLVAFIAGCLS